MAQGRTHKVTPPPTGAFRGAHTNILEHSTALFMNALRTAYTDTNYTQTTIRGSPTATPNRSCIAFTHMLLHVHLFHGHFPSKHFKATTNVIMCDGHMHTCCHVHA